VLAPAFNAKAAPFAFVSEKSTCALLKATNPAPSPTSFCNVTVNVCGAPTSFVADGAIEIFAFTHVFVAGPEFAPTPFVSRCSDTPPTERVVCALTVVIPVTFESRLIWQEPVPPAVVHGFAVVNPPGPLSIVKLIDVPSGAGTKPLPLFTFTCAVNVCVAPTRFTPFGVIWMFASTNVLTALPEFGATPSVWTVNGAEPLTEPVQEACPVTVPAVPEVKVAETCPAAFVVAMNGPAGVATAPLLFVSVIVTV
jgi:hypothetical protein